MAYSEKNSILEKKRLPDSHMGKNSPQDLSKLCKRGLDIMVIDDLSIVRNFK